MTGREIAVEFAEMFDDLDSADINTMLAKNVSMDMLEFFSTYADQFADECAAGRNVHSSMSRSVVAIEKCDTYATFAVR